MKMKDVVSIKADGLTKKFGNFTAVDNISFEVMKGEIFGFLGPNGAGKTTVIRMLCGLLIPTAGEAFIEGYNIKTQSDLIKAITGYMSQKFSLYTDLTVQENILFYAGIYGVSDPESKTRDIIAYLDLGKYKDTISSELPAGIRQRVTLAASFIHNPKILFLDEPTAGVDPLLRRRFWDITKDLSRSGTTILVTTHYMDEAENCDRIVLINQAKLVDIGTVDSIKARYKDGNILYLELADNYMENFKRIKNINMPVKDISLHGSVVHMIQDIDILQARKILERYCRSEGIKYSQIFEDRPSLEDVFINLVKVKEKV